MGTEYWILKCPQFISYTEKQRLKIQSRGQTLENTILKTKTKTHKKILEIYMKFDLKIGLLSLFLQGYSVMIKLRSSRGVIEDFERK